MPPIRIALAQTCPISAPSGPPKLEKPHSTTPFPTLDANLADAASYVVQAKAAGADIVVFPEYFLQGIVNESRQYLTFPSKHLTTALQTLAREHDISIVGTIVHGSLPPSASPASAFPTSSPFENDGKAKHEKITPAQLEWARWLESHPATVEDNLEPILHNTAFFIEGGTGTVLGEYIKRNLWHPERDYLTAGKDDHGVFQTKWGKMGMMICWDMSHPAAAATMADQGAEVILAPTYWTATDSEPIIHNHDHPDDYEVGVIHALAYARAFETETIWVMVNAGGDPLEGFAGGSGVWAPLRGKIGGLGIEAGMKIIDVNTDLLQDARKLYKIREDASKRDAT